MAASMLPPVATRSAPRWQRDFQALLDAYRQAGGEPAALTTPGAAFLLVSANRVLLSSPAPGVRLQAEETRHGVRAHIVVEPGVDVGVPVHLCFGMLPPAGRQTIQAEYEIGAGARVRFIAHCTFPNAVRLRHSMDARIHVGPGARMTYEEAHFHGPHGGIVVLPRARVVIDQQGRFSTTFSLLHGRVGRLLLDYVVVVGPGGVAELITRAYASAEDDVTVKETLHLDGEGARGQTRTRIAARDRAMSQVLTTAEGNAPYARGHMDCTEVVQGRALARNCPVVVVRHERAQITHEAAIGAVNREELETLMARGLDEDAAVDVIIRGMLE